MRERETQELLKMGAGGGTEKKPTTSTKSFSRTMKMLGKVCLGGKTGGLNHLMKNEPIVMSIHIFIF